MTVGWLVLSTACCCLRCAWQSQPRARAAVLLLSLLWVSFAGWRVESIP
jgi:hypothetical protein